MSMREDLGAALDAHAEDNNYDETPQEVLVDETSEETNFSGDEHEAESSTGEQERQAPEESDGKADDTTPGDKQAAQKQKGDESVLAGDATEKRDTRSIKPPIDWSPKEREDWSRIPPHLQKKIMAREQDMTNIMADTKEARQTHTEMTRLAQTYGSALSGVVGNTPLEATENLFTTVANLRMGSPMEKANIVAGLMDQFGVDVNTLDSVLSGQLPDPSQQANAGVEQLLDQRLAPVNQLIERMQREEQNRVHGMQNAAVSEVKQFADSGQAEFLNDVRMDMADIIDMAAKRGVDMPMQEAYNRACSLHPQVSQVLADRAKQQQLVGNNNSMASKRNAASSITGHRGGSGGARSATTIRGDIENAWNSQGE